AAHLPAAPSKGGCELLRRLFEPLGYGVEHLEIPLDERFPEWADSSFVDLRVRRNVLLKDLLAHLYVLPPVLDDQKHYWVSDDEVEKLLAKGGDWLAQHPDKELIAARYLRHRKGLMRQALERLLEEDQSEVEETEERHDDEEIALEERVSLRDQRLGSVLAALRSSGASSVIDLGCGDGRLLSALIKE